MPRALKICQVAPLFESVPPKGYGGTERIVSYLTEELVRLGHEVTLYASGDSVTGAELVAPCARSLRSDGGSVDQLAHHLVMLEQVFADADRYDLIHCHVDYLHFPFSKRHPVPTLTTLHGRLDIPDLVTVYREYPGMPVVSISDAQREPLPWLNWQGTVYHGLPVSQYPFQESAGTYLAFLGRISPEKRVDRAIEIARRVGWPIKIAAKIDRADQAYFEAHIKRLLDEPGVEFLGEIGEQEKAEFLGRARALLFPIDWREPFGIVMIEAMACGTPVVAYRNGSVPEIVEDGATGYIVEDLDGAERACARVDSLSRRGCREAFEARFTDTRMAEDYVALYRQLVEQPLKAQAQTALGTLR